MNETNPNQKTVRVEKERCDKNNLYAMYNLQALSSAMLDLKGETFKLWCYLNKNQNGYTFALTRSNGVQAVKAHTIEPLRNWSRKATL